MQRVDIRLEDDLTGGSAEETVHFGLDGRAYEIDLNAKHAATFRKQLGAFIEHARPARGRRHRTSTRTAASRDRSRAIRKWADHEGLEVAAHGRLPADVIAEYERAHSVQPGHQRSGRRRRSLPDHYAGAWLIAS